MSDESYSFSTARARLEEIVTQVRKKDTSLEKSLDLLEEGVRLANTCTELIDHADGTVGGVVDPAAGDGETAESSEAESTGEGTDAAASSETADEGDSPAGDGAAPAGDDAEFAPDDDAFGDAADEAWSDDTPEYRDDEA